MSNGTAAVPGPSHHKASGQSVVRLNGHDFYLGPYGSAKAKAEYDQIIAEWLAHGRQLPNRNTGLSVAELIVAYVNHAEVYYTKDGEPTSELGVIRQAMKWLRRSKSRTPVDEFGPRSFKTVRQMMIDAGMSRATVNGYMNRIRRCFRWGVEQELVPPGSASEFTGRFRLEARPIRGPGARARQTGARIAGWRSSAARRLASGGDDPIPAA